MSKRMYKYGSLIMAVMMLFCGCGKNSENDKKTKKNAAEAILIQMQQPESFNPLSAKNHSIRDALAICYEPLFELGSKFELKGVLAKSIQVSDDCLSAVISLKEGVSWHDGISLTSADVVHTINTLQENSTWEYAQCVKNIDRANPIDPLTVKIELKEPYGQIAYSLTFPIIPAHNKKPDEKIVGTGAYRLEKYTPSTMLEFVPNKDWHGGKTAKSLVNVSILRDAQTATTSFNTGLLNAITSNSYDLENNVPKENISLKPFHSVEYEFLALNHNNPLFKSQSVRNAISSAIDRNKIAAECYADNAQPANSPIHPVSQNMTASIASLFSLANTNELLFLEGFVLDENNGVLKSSEGKEFSFEILVNRENQNRVSTAKMLREQLFAAGINVSVREVSFDTYTTRIRQGSFDAYLGGTRLSNIYDVEFLLGEKGAMNNFGYAGKDISPALNGLAMASTEEARETAVDSFEEVFSREQPVCGILFKKWNLMTTDAVKGKIFPQTNNPYRKISTWTVK